MADRKQDLKAAEKNRQYYPALRGIFGDWVYYSCLMPLEDVANRIKFADDIHPSKKLSDWIQRKIKGKRTKEITAYLVREEQRFFNSLVVAIYGGQPAWHGFSNFKPLAPDIDLEDVPDEVEDSVGFLSFSGSEEILAIDGQHRLAGIKEAILQRSELKKDDVSLVLVSHSKTKAGMERTRRLFTTLNKTAVPVRKGEIIALDENDVMAIVTRWLVDHDDRFSAGARILLSQKENIPKEATQWTTIGNVYDVLEAVFPVAPHNPKTMLKSIRDLKKMLKSIRPNDGDLKKYTLFAQSFFNHLSEMSGPLQKYFDAPNEEANKLARRYRGDVGGPVLFRPVGLRIFAEVFAELMREGVSVDRSYSLLGKLPSDLSKTPYEGVIWDSATNTMRPAARPVCRRLLLHMLGREKKPKDLLDRYAKTLGRDRSQIKLPVRIT